MRSLPWVSAGIFSVNGIEGDGQITAALGVGLLAIGLSRRSGKRAAIAALPVAAVIALIGWYDYSQVDGDVASAGIGLYGTIGAGMVGVVAALVLINKAPSAGRIDAAPPNTPPPAGWHPDPYGKAAYRLWDGERWTELTREAPPTERRGLSR